MAAAAMVLAEQPRAYVQRRWRELCTDRQQFESLWRDLAEYYAPRRGRFIPEDKNRRPIYESILDSSPTHFAKTLAAGMVAGVTSPTRPWFELRVATVGTAQSFAARRWLSEAQRRVLEALHGSNFYSVVQGLYLDAAIFGTGAMMLLEDKAARLRAHHLPVGSYVIATDSSGRVNTVVRRRRFTVAQLVEEFGEAQVSEDVRRAWREKRLSEERTALHLVEPRMARDRAKQDRLNMPWRSLWVEESGNEDKVLLESGFQEFPAVVLRWDTIGEDAWGNGPGEEALGDAKQLQLGEEWGLEAIEKHVRPPVNAATTLDGRPIGIHPSDVNMGGIETGGKSLVAPVFQVQPHIDTLEAKQAQVRARIGRSFFADLFRLMLDLGVSGGKMTAREVEERAQERMLMLGPVLERVDDDVVDVVVPRSLGILMRSPGMLPPVPDDLSGVDYAIENVSIFAQAQKRAGFVPVRELLAFAAEMAQINPEALDTVDPIAAVEIAAETLGADARILRNPQEVRQQREMRAQQQQAAVAAQQASALADTAAKSAGAVRDLAESSPDQANPLQRIADLYQ